MKLYLVVNNRVFDSIQSSELRLKGLKMLLKEIALEGIIHKTYFLLIQYSEEIIMTLGNKISILLLYEL